MSCVRKKELSLLVELKVSFVAPVVLIKWAYSKPFLSKKLIFTCLLKAHLIRVKKAAKDSVNSIRRVSSFFNVVKSVSVKIR